MVTGWAAASMVAAMLVGAAPAMAGTGPEIGAEAGAIDLAVAVDAPSGGLLVQEMARVTVRAVFDAQPNLVTLADPEMADAKLLRLAPDRWGADRSGGPRRVVLERVLGYVPQRGGGLVLPPFRLSATMMAGGAPVPVVSASAALAISVAPSRAGPGVWWLPARSVTVTERWSRDPDGLRPGQTAQRVVVVQADGVEASQLPPLAAPEVPGLDVFTLPVARETTLSAAGPQARATYRWDLRSRVAGRLALPALRVAWFDILSREGRQAALAARSIGVAGPPPEVAAAVPPHPLRVATGIAGVVGLGVAMAAWVRGSGGARRAARRALRRAAKAGDGLAMRRGLIGLRVAGAADQATIAAALEALDRHLYGKVAGRGPDLAGLARAVLGTAAARPGAATAGGLAPIDGVQRPAAG